MGDFRAYLSMSHNDAKGVKEASDAMQREIICKSNIPGKLKKNEIQTQTRD